MDYEAAAHAVQTGVAYDPVWKGYDADQRYKHLRTGIDLSKAEHAGLARLLMAKGIITMEEYLDAMTQAVREEKARYEDYLRQVHGITIKLA